MHSKHQYSKRYIEKECCKPGALRYICGQCLMKYSGFIIIYCTCVIIIIQWLEVEIRYVKKKRKTSKLFNNTFLIFFTSFFLFLVYFIFNHLHLQSFFFVLIKFIVAEAPFFFLTNSLVDTF